MREGSKITIEYNPKCSSFNDPEEKNTSEDNPNSKLTSTGSRSDYSSCDAKKSQDSKIATDLDCGKASADSNSQGKNANSTSEHASDNGNATIEEQDHDSYSKNSRNSESRKKRQESKNTSEDDAASEDVNENGKKIHGSKNTSENLRSLHVESCTYNTRQVQNFFKKNGKKVVHFYRGFYLHEGSS